jgi:hypothetical protein
MVFRLSSEYWIADPTLTIILEHSQKNEIKALVDNFVRCAHYVPQLTDMGKNESTSRSMSD